MSSHSEIANLPILAITFGNPLMLWGLLLATIPLLLHFFHRRRYQTHRWAAMQFLHAAARKTTRHNQFENYLLLLLRTLLIALVVLALAYPQFETSNQALLQPKPKQRIIVIDTTLSMRQQQNGRSAFQQAKQYVRQYIEKANARDIIHLVRISSLEPYQIFSLPSIEQDRVLDELDALQPTYEAGNLLEVLREVETLVADTKGNADKEVLFVTDLQATCWQPPDHSEMRKMNKLLQRISAQANLSIWELSTDNSDNCAITKLETSSSPSFTNEDVVISVHVQNYGGTPAERDLITEIDGEIIGSQSVIVAPGEAQVITATHRFEAAGDAVIRVQLGDDRLSADNVRWVRQEIRSSHRVLLVNGKPSAEEMGNATDYVQLALKTNLSGPGNTGRFFTEVVTEEDLNNINLDNYDVVFLCNIGLFTERETSRLEQYVQRGGAVVISLGDQVQAENYNHRLYRQGMGLLPAELLQIKHYDSETSESFEFLTSNNKHPLFEEFEKYPDAGLTNTPTFTYFRTKINPRSSNIVLRFSTSDAAMAERKMGQGRVMLVTTSFDRAWSAFVVWPSFLPTMHELVPYLNRPYQVESAWLVGQPIVMPLQEKSTSQTYLLTTPTGEQHSVQEVATTSDIAQIVYPHTTHPGIYELHEQQSEHLLKRVSVNVDPRESELTPALFSQLQSTLFDDVNVTYSRDFSANNTAKKGNRLQNWSVSIWLLLLVVGLALVEQLIAWKFLAGLQALAVLLLASVVFVLLNTGLLI